MILKQYVVSILFIKTLTNYNDKNIIVKKKKFNDLKLCVMIFSKTLMVHEIIN